MAHPTITDLPRSATDVHLSHRLANIPSASSTPLEPASAKHADREPGTPASSGILPDERSSTSNQSSPDILASHNNVERSGSTYSMGSIVPSPTQNSASSGKATREGKRRAQHSQIRLTSSMTSLSIPTIARQHAHASPFPPPRASALFSSGEALSKYGGHSSLDQISRRPNTITSDVTTEPRNSTAHVSTSEAQASLFEGAGSDSTFDSGGRSSSSSTSRSSSSGDSESISSDLSSLPSSDFAPQAPHGSDRNISLHVQNNKFPTQTRQEAAVSTTESIATAHEAENALGNGASLSCIPTKFDQSKEQQTSFSPNIVQDTLIDHHRRQQIGQVKQTPSLPTIAQRDTLAAKIYEACASAGQNDWVALLDYASLASQHHLSGYNALKFGQEGSPFLYLPLTLQQPGQTEELMARQKVKEARALEWLVQKRARREAVSISPKKQRLKSPVCEDDEVIQDDSRIPNVRANGCFAEKDSSLQKASLLHIPATDPTDSTINVHGQCSTANGKQGSMQVSCGPLKNEAVMTQEWEAPLEPCEADKEANGNFKTIAGATEGSKTSQSDSHVTKTSDTHPISISPIIPPELLADVSRYIQAGIPPTVDPEDCAAKYGYGHSGDANAAMLAREHHQMQELGSRLIRCRLTCLDLSDIALKAEEELRHAAHSKRRPRLLKIERGESANDVLRTSFRDPTLQDTTATEAQRTYAALQGQSSIAESSSEMQVPTSTSQKSFVMGNLLLSSCPGKKVRLTGPVRGRGAICRSLDIDLKRAKELGVGAIVCCLDDEELQFLGAPWPQYESEVDKLGVEVIRLPMAEGFCPTDVTATDEAISCVVNDYTLRGIHVLVHCRGGVGRAGLIACMWMLKLGLIRSDSDEQIFKEMASAGYTKDVIQKAMARSETDVRQTVVRLVDTIRRRRSPKAIETAEQVIFLTKYIKYLHAQEAKSWHFASGLSRTTAAEQHT